MIISNLQTFVAHIGAKNDFYPAEDHPLRGVFFCPKNRFLAACPILPKRSGFEKHALKGRN